ncbi:MAG: HVO_0476 family zinc finger protein [Methanoregula sp.]|nr:HVO_0476 family zinc finger protein [Methanoregula sp.]
MFISIHCPQCGEKSEHEVVADSRERLVRCTTCNHVHRLKKEKASEPVMVKTIVSRGDSSMVCGIELMGDDECSIDDHLVAECGDEAFGVEVTGIERGERRVKRARAQEITTLWTRVIEQVIVKISIHDGRKTIPLYRDCDGEDPFIVGEICTVQGKRFKISQLKLRDGPLMRKEGWKTVAHRIKRVYGYRL